MPHRPGWPRRDADHLLVDSATMAALEEELFASGLPVASLMEKAALALSRRLLEHPPEAALVLVGPGHNGGDGLVVARELHLAGIPVRIWAPFPHPKPLTEAHLRHALWLGIPRLEEPPDPQDGALWIDALFGIGQRRAPGEALEGLLEQRQESRPGLLAAIDVPTGLCADTGRLLGRSAACASRTWCLGLRKRGLLEDRALRWVGELTAIDLGLPAKLLEVLPIDTPLSLGPEDRSTAPWPQEDPAASKYGRGRLLVVAGSPQFLGAAQLALSGASAAGCGSLRAAVPAPIAEALWSLHPHVVLAGSAAATVCGCLALASLPPSWLERLDAVLLGPGIGTPPDGRTLEGEAERWQQLQAFPGLLVLDADGLNRLAQGSAMGIDPGAWLAERAGPSWITPHGGEFARLFPSWAELPPLEAAARAAQRCGAGVLLKGARTVVAAPDGRRWQLREAAPAVARAGLGDVLAGYCGGVGARAVAALGPGVGLDASLLAAAALDHACAGLTIASPHPHGHPPGPDATPQGVAVALSVLGQAQPWGAGGHRESHARSNTLPVRDR
jgi:NAD(P)H-hydrate epimerase